MEEKVRLLVVARSHKGLYGPSHFFQAPEKEK